MAAIQFAYYCTLLVSFVLTYTVHVLCNTVTILVRLAFIFPANHKSLSVPKLAA